MFVFESTRIDSQYGHNVEIGPCIQVENILK